MQEMKVSAEVRETVGGKGKLSAMRASRTIPAVIYGGETEPVAVAIKEKDFMAIRKNGANTIVNFDLGKNSCKAVVKDLQYHPVTEAVVHADFQRVTDKNTVMLNIPVKLQGVPPGVKSHGATVTHVLRKLKIRANAVNIPAEIVLDISTLKIGYSIYVKDIPANNFKIEDAQESTVVHLSRPRNYMDEDKAAAAGAPAAGAAATAEKK